MNEERAHRLIEKIEADSTLTDKEKQEAINDILSELREYEAERKWHETH